MSDYQQRDTEWGPHPQKAENIFISICIKELLINGTIAQKDYKETLERFVIESALAWQGAQSTLRRGQLDAVRQMMGFADTVDALKADGAKLAQIPQTTTERETSMTIYETRKRELQGQQQQAPPQQQHQPSEPPMPEVYPPGGYPTP